jgi:hypothetical protein
MGENQGEETEWDRKKTKEPQEADGEDGLGDNEIGVKEIEEFSDPSPLCSVKNEKHTHGKADEGGKDCDDQGVEKGMPEMGRVEEELMVPFEGKAFPRRRKPFGIKRKDEQNDDWYIEEEVDAGDEDQVGKLCDFATVNHVVSPESSGR